MIPVASVGFHKARLCVLTWGAWGSEHIPGEFTMHAVQQHGRRKTSLTHGLVNPPVNIISISIHSTLYLTQPLIYVSRGDVSWMQ